MAWKPRFLLQNRPGGSAGAEIAPQNSFLWAGHGCGDTPADFKRGGPCQMPRAFLPLRLESPGKKARVSLSASASWKPWAIKKGGDDRVTQVIGLARDTRAAFSWIGPPIRRDSGRPAAAGVLGSV